MLCRALFSFNHTRSITQYVFCPQFYLFEEKIEINSEKILMVINEWKKKHKITPQSMQNAFWFSENSQNDDCFICVQNQFKCLRYQCCWLAHCVTSYCINPIFRYAPYIFHSENGSSPIVLAKHQFIIGMAQIWRRKNSQQFSVEQKKYNNSWL